MSDRGEGFTSVDVGSNGMPVVCNSRGCRPVLLNDRFRDWNGRPKSVPRWPMDGVGRGEVGGEAGAVAGGEGVRGLEVEAGGRGEMTAMGRANGGDVRANGFAYRHHGQGGESATGHSTGHAGVAQDPWHGVGGATSSASASASADDDNHLRGSLPPGFHSPSAPWVPPDVPVARDGAAPHRGDLDLSAPNLRVPVVVPPLVAVGRRAQGPMTSGLPAFDSGGSGNSSGGGDEYVGGRALGHDGASEILMDDRPIWAPMNGIRARPLDGNVAGGAAGAACTAGDAADGACNAAGAGRKANGVPIPSNGSPMPPYHQESLSFQQQEQHHHHHHQQQQQQQQQERRRGDEQSGVNGAHGATLESDGGSARSGGNGRGHGAGRVWEGSAGAREQAQAEAEREREREDMEQYYRAALMEHPQQSLFLGNYAQFLAEGKDYERAEEAFRRAAVASRAEGGAGEAEVLVAWAKVVWEAGGDAERAMALFERAVELSPDDWCVRAGERAGEKRGKSFVLAAYASFLWSAESGQEPAATQPAQPDVSRGGDDRLCSCHSPATLQQAGDCPSGAGNCSRCCGDHTNSGTGSSSSSDLARYVLNSEAAAADSPGLEDVSLSSCKVVSQGQVQEQEQLDGRASHHHHHSSIACYGTASNGTATPNGPAAPALPPHPHATGTCSGVGNPGRSSSALLGVSALPAVCTGRMSVGMAVSCSSAPETSCHQSAAAADATAVPVTPLPYVDAAQS
ncbi:unnamed protein product [Closterium sp. NIES-65]|nr:unnamed protein product [Closterium sp. NIES-65]